MAHWVRRTVGGRPQIFREPQILLSPLITKDSYSFACAGLNVIAVSHQDKQTVHVSGHVCRDSQSLLFLPYITVLAFVVMGTLRKKLKKRSRSTTFFEHCTLFFGRTFFKVSWSTM